MIDKLLDRLAGWVGAGIDWWAVCTTGDVVVRSIVEWP